MTPKEHGLLFRGAMVRALLAGRKTETRRPITWSNSLVNGDSFPKRLWPDLDFTRAWIDPGPSPAGNDGPYLKVPFAMRDADGNLTGDEAIHRVYPRIDRGDRIWARETWSDTPSGEPDFRVDHRGALALGSKAYPWRSAIHLPRRFARIVLDVTDKTIPQRACDLSDEQKIAEGFPLPERDPEGGVTFDMYWQRIHHAPPDATWCWAYRGLRRIEQAEATRTA